MLPLIALPFFRKYLDDQRGEDQKFDFLGGLLLGGTVAFLLLSISQTNMMFFLVGMVLFALFIWRINTAHDPFIQPKLFRNKQYSYGLLIAFLGTGISFGLPYLAPQFLNSLNQLTPAIIGLVMFPAAIASALLGKRGGVWRIAKEIRFSSIQLYRFCLFVLSACLRLWVRLRI